MVTSHPPVSDVWRWLEEIPDPEIPALSIVDLGIIRDVQSDDRTGVIVTVTPTYSGCPAMDVIASEIRRTLNEHGIDHLRLETRLAPPWTTDWLGDEAKERLRVYGIAPPQLVRITAEQPGIACPLCGSDQTELISQFGSTPCKALYKCLACLEPFDAFKSH